MVSSVASSLIQQASQSLGISALTNASSSSNSASSITGSNSSGDQAQISGPGQLLSDLQQIQSQNPSEFKQLTATISQQLAAAAQQTTGSQSQFLTDLSSQFQNASTSGNLSSLQTSSHHHGHHGQGVYNQAGQVSQAAALTSSAISGTSSTDGTSSSGNTLQQLFATISTEVSQALGS